MATGKILCIDDDKLGLTVRKLILESEGYDVTLATAGQEGLELMSGSNFDLVLLDHSMPGMGGGEVARQIRRHYPATPIIFLSAYVTLPEEDKRLVDAYVTKGESTSTLLRLVRELIERSARS